MRERLFDLIPTLLSFLYKNKCVCCKRFACFSVCDECKKKIEFNSFESIRTIDNVKLYSATDYSGPVKEMICGFKFNKRKDIAYDLTKLVYSFYKNTNFSDNQFHVVPVPIHESKRKSRGFDQSYIIAKNLSFITGNKFTPKLLKRIKETRPQFKLKPSERQENLKDAFDTNLDTYQNLPVLLIDDICTTGTTLKEAIKALKENNINDIIALTISSVEIDEISN